MSGARPRCAYVHVPFCRHRCGYCNFTVVAGRDDLISDFLKALEIELSWLGEPQPVDTLFLGGGTPTHLPPKHLATFFSLVDHWFPTNEQSEVSIEANPEDITRETADILEQTSVNRVSLGVQSFRDEKLKTLERSHSSAMVHKGVELLRPHVASLSVDLIFGAPQETLPQWEDDLEQAIGLPVDHISTYGLTYERGTSFYSRQLKNELQVLPEETELAMYESAIGALSSAGFEHYEVSNFAKPKHRCRHNENYWFCGEFYGVGPGASRYVDGKRESNHRSTTKYLQCVLDGRPATNESDTLTHEDAARERLVFGLRRLDGVNLASFRTATGLDVRELVGDPLDWLLSEGLLEMDDVTIRLSKKGLLVSDSIWPNLL